MFHMARQDSKDKLFLISIEVTAKNIVEALSKKGRIYKIEESLTPPEKEKPVGFNK